MRTSQIKQELDERGVPYRGLLEKSEFVDALVDARARGITATASGDDGGGKATAADEDGAEDAAGAEKDNDGFDSSYKDVEASKRVTAKSRPATAFGRVLRRKSALRD